MGLGSNFKIRPSRWRTNVFFFLLHEKYPKQPHHERIMNWNKGRVNKINIEGKDI
jgi:hypothetical protein